MSLFTITNAFVVTPTGTLEAGNMVIEDGVITHVGEAIPVAGEILDARGCLVMPGIIDMHTDALESEINPRPRADMPLDIAFRELERKMSGCGFTTVFHSLHLGYQVAEVMSLSKYTRKNIFETIHKLANGHTIINNKIHLRFELTGVDAYDTCMELMDKGYVSLLSLMDHTPGQGQNSVGWFIKVSMRNGKSEAQAKKELEEFQSRPKLTDEQIARMISLAKQKNIVVASHDDDTPEKVIRMNRLGITICEFPINAPSARQANNLGMYVVGGASNVLRGGSLSNNLHVEEALLANTVNMLCSDYYPSSLLHAVWKMVHTHHVPWHVAVNWVSLMPAKATGLASHTGSIEPGKHADLILVKPVQGVPMVTHTIVGGQIVSQTAAKVYQPQVV